MVKREIWGRHGMKSKMDCGMGGCPAGHATYRVFTCKGVWNRTRENIGQAKETAQNGTSSALHLTPDGVIYFQMITTKWKI